MPLVAKYDIQYSLFLHQFNHIPYHRRKEMNLLSHFRTLEVSRLQCSFTLCYSMGLVSRASSSWEAWSQSTAASWHGIGKARQSHGGLRLSEDICRIWQRLHKQYQRIQEYSTIFQNIPECFRMFQTTASLCLNSDSSSLCSSQASKEMGKQSDLRESNLGLPMRHIASTGYTMFDIV